MAKTKPGTRSDRGNNEDVLRTLPRSDANAIGDGIWPRARGALASALRSTLGRSLLLSILALSVIFWPNSRLVWVAALLVAAYFVVLWFDSYRRAYLRRTASALIWFAVLNLTVPDFVIQLDAHLEQNDSSDGKEGSGSARVIISPLAQKYEPYSAWPAVASILTAALLLWVDTRERRSPLATPAPAVGRRDRSQKLTVLNLFGTSIVHQSAPLPLDEASLAQPLRSALSGATQRLNRCAEAEEELLDLCKSLESAIRRGDEESGVASAERLETLLARNDSHLLSAHAAKAYGRLAQFWTEVSRLSSIDPVRSMYSQRAQTAIDRARQLSSSTGDARGFK